MSNGPRCPHCSSTTIRWVTLRREVPVDVLQCQDCGHTMAEEDWVAPVLPLVPGRCINCGHQRRQGVCTNCGLSHQEDMQVHDELRQVIAPKSNLLQAAREASRQGRRLIALKLATAAAAFNEEDQGAVARALRVWLLSAIGESLAALEDCKTWVEQTPDPPTIAWVSLGQQYQHGGFPGTAADAYGRALQKDPDQHAIRARRANLLMQMRREGQAGDEARLVLAIEGLDAATVAPAIEVLDALADRYDAQLRDDEVELILEGAGIYLTTSAVLLAHRARIAALAGDSAAARKDLKAAKHINPDLPIYEKIEKLIQPTRSSWWRW